MNIHKDERSLALLRNWLEADHGVDFDLVNISSGETYGAEWRLISERPHGTVVVSTDLIAFFPGDTWATDGGEPTREVDYDIAGATGWHTAGEILRTIDYVFEPDQIDRFHTQAVRTLLWSEMDEDGNPLEDSNAALSDESAADLRSDCEVFLTAHGHEVRQAMLTDDGLGGAGSYDIDNAAHDFVLTANGHGAGFWDRGLGQIGERLTEVVRNYGWIAYVGDDGKVWVQ